jgi:hypothetical protein
MDAPIGEGPFSAERYIRNWPGMGVTGPGDCGLKSCRIFFIFVIEAIKPATGTGSAFGITPWPVTGKL